MLECKLSIFKYVSELKAVNRCLWRQICISFRIYILLRKTSIIRLSLLGWVSWFFKFTYLLYITRRIQASSLRHFLESWLNSFETGTGELTTLTVFLYLFVMYLIYRFYTYANHLRTFDFYALGNIDFCYLASIENDKCFSFTYNQRTIQSKCLSVFLSFTRFFTCIVAAYTLHARGVDECTVHIGICNEIVDNKTRRLHLFKVNSIFFQN